ncbi:hypothetical protein JQX13_41260 [Archangium violaceum]|uniref:alpha/beta hydrolase n=1 Tax=Archangium violaceum TaxID=83451 RepID=UPI00193B7D23|nr:hypothetical protein [Archangium violaceum]QRK06466.1 hypothetical protein JQX13_41260 [Archangium violaceum]
MYRLRLTSNQLALFSSVTRSDALKREMISATTKLPPGTVVRLGERTLRLGAPLGSGLVGTVSEARCADTGERFALKRARAAIRTFQEFFRLEAAATEALSGLTALRPARIIERTSHALLKELLHGSTLQMLILQGALGQEQRDSFVEVLRQVADIHTRLGFLVDLSPKNVCWQDGWVLVDAGPKTHTTDYVTLLAEPGWEQYVRYFERKGSLARGGSAPSVLVRPVSDAGIANARSFAFVRDWWMWIPYDPHVEPGRFFVTIDETQQEDEAAFRVELDRGAELVPVPGVEARLAESELVRACALEAWKRQHPHLPALAQGEPRPLPFTTSREPLSLAALATETEPWGLAKALKRAFPAREELQVPDLPVQPYPHWTELGRAGSPHRPTDILCHEPLRTSRVALDTLLSRHRHFTATPPLTRTDGPFCELLCIPSGDCRRAVLFLPGFRASVEAEAALVSALLARGLDGLFVLTHMGVRNSSGQALVTAGRWETVLLWDVIDYVTECLGASEVVLVSASHGAIAAVLVADLHPRVTALTLDSCVRRPLDLVAHLAQARGESPGTAIQSLVEHHIPQPFQLREPTRSHLRVLSMYSRQDRLVAACGAMPVGTLTLYEGGHAATMRHDSSEKGVPEVCVDALHAFLGETSS